MKQQISVLESQNSLEKKCGENASAVISELKEKAKKLFDDSQIKLEKSQLREKSCNEYRTEFEVLLKEMSKNNNILTLELIEKNKKLDSCTLNVNKTFSQKKNSTSVIKYLNNKYAKKVLEIKKLASSTMQGENWMMPSLKINNFEVCR